MALSSTSNDTSVKHVILDTLLPVGLKRTIIFEKTGSSTLFREFGIPLNWLGFGSQ